MSSSALRGRLLRQRWRRRPLGESGSLQFRVETFNILNRANFVRPSQPVFSSPSATVLQDAGRITATSNKARTIQFALKVLW